MKILFISNTVPNPAGGGSPRRAAIHLKALREMGEVTLVVPPGGSARMVDTAGMTVLERGPAVSDVRKWRHEGSRSPVKRLVHALFRRNHVDGRESAAKARRFRAALSGHFDLIFAFRLRSATWAEPILGRRSQSIRIVDLDDIESVVFSKEIEQSAGPWPWRVMLRRQLRWLLRTERRVAMEWDAVCLCSRLDADRFKAATGVEPWIVPNAYAFGSSTSEPIEPVCRLLFVGTFRYFPNAEGITWFVETIWPLVHGELGDGVTLDLVGINPPPEILAFGERAGITVAGNVPSVDPWYAAANIVIAPLNAGSGTRIKLIEAAAMRRAIVTTTLGCEGLGFVDGVHAEIADDPADFAARIVALARDATRRTTMADACYELARKCFSRETIVRDLQGRIGDALHARLS